MKKIISILLLGAMVSVSHTQAQPRILQPAQEAARQQALLEELPIVEDDKWNIDLTVEKDSFSAGEPISLGITIKNAGASKTKIMLVEVEKFYDIQVIGPLSTPVPMLTSGLERRWGSYRALDMGVVRSKSGSITLNNLFDMSLAGNYKINVSKKFRFKDLNKGPLLIKSNTLMIGVTSTLPISKWD